MLCGNGSGPFGLPYHLLPSEYSAVTSPANCHSPHEEGSYLLHCLRNLRQWKAQKRMSPSPSYGMRANIFFRTLLIGGRLAPDTDSREIGCDNLSSVSLTKRGMVRVDRRESRMNMATKHQ